MWCLDGHDKLARWGIEIYGCVDAYSRNILSFYVGHSNRTSLSIFCQYLQAIRSRGVRRAILRSDRGTETPMMADAHYYFYWFQHYFAEATDKELDVFISLTPISTAVNGEYSKLRGAGIS
jgi:hypothetical protein